MPGFGVSARYCSRIKGASKAANADRGASTEELNIKWIYMGFGYGNAMFDKTRVVLGII